MKQLPSLLKFIQMLHQFQNVERVVRVNGNDRWENDVEHSYQLAMSAWYIADAMDLGLDKDLLVKYGLLHDLVEVYAGDTYIYDEEHKKTKAQREAAAAVLLTKNFPEFGELHKLIDSYESKQDRESRFIYALDKVMPVINIYLDDGRTWREKEVTLQMLIDNKKEKVALSPEIAPYFDELIALLKDREEPLFRGNGEQTTAR